MSIRPTPPAPTPARRPLPSAWALGWRQWRQDLRSGELRLLLLAIMLAVGASSAVAFFADRLQAGLTRDAGALLGGDLVIASDQPLPDEFAAQARAMGLGQASNASFPSMARAAEAQGGASRLVAVKAVSEHYPLRGELEISPVGDGQPARKLRQGPPAGEVWADAAVLEALNLKPGDPLLLGDASLRLSAVLRLEPDRGAGFINFAPRVMLNAADLPATGLIQPASRVTWRLAVAAPAGAGRSGQTALQAYQAWAQDRLNTLALRGVRLETLDQGRPEMRQTLDRASQFLHLVAVLAGLLAAVAVAIAARNFAQRRLDACALLRVLGLPRRLIAQAYLVEFGLAGLLASLAGVAVGLAVQQVFAALLGSLVGTALPAPGWRPAGLGLAVGLTLLAAFGLPPLLQLAQVPPLRVLRRQLGGLRAGSASVLIGGVLGYGALLVVSADDLKLGLVTVAGFGVAWGLFAALAWLAVMVLRRAVPDVGAPRWLLLATRQLAARPGLVVLQVSALSLGLLALLLLVVLRTDLIESWRAATPPGTPDRFVINIQPDQAASFRATLDGAGVNGYDWHPMIRGRLTLVNDK
ncbi:MAG: hypothetical protein RL722_1608, partial [Pseudomonadota bacterium]